MLKVLPEPTLTSSLTGKLQTTIPSRLARKLGIKTGMRLEWMGPGTSGSITARILPDPISGKLEISVCIFSESNGCD